MPKNLNSKPIFYIHNLSEGGIKWYGDTHALLGFSPEELSTREDFLKLLHDKDRSSYLLNINNRADEISFEYCIIVGGNEIHVKELAIKSKSGPSEYLQGIITNNESGRTSAGKGKYNVSGKAILTGKFDSLFLENLRKYYVEANRNRHNYLLLLVSIDNLPMIVTWQGETVANMVMDDLCEKVKGVLPKNGFISRVNSDQLGIILQNPVANEVDSLVNDISKLVIRYRHPNLEDAVHLSLSIGSVAFPLGVKDEVDILNKAYLALTHAKSKEYEFYSDYEDAKREHIDAQNEMSQLHYLQEAFSENRVMLAYQPVISTIDGSTDSYECLLRIDDGRGRIESAGRLIGVAEKMGTVETIDEFVLKAAIAEMEISPSINVNINVSNLTTSSDQWLKMCSDLLQDEKLASRITFEITETAAQRDLRKTAYFTAAIQGLGCKVSLDDFGVGFTSFRQLRSLSINSLKIDGSFILGLEENKENLIFIKSLIDFGKSYGLQTVAECVENGEVAKKLMEMGVDFMQGYYFGKPETGRPWEKKAVVGQ